MNENPNPYEPPVMAELVEKPRRSWAWILFAILVGLVLLNIATGVYLKPKQSTRVLPHSTSSPPLVSASSSFGTSRFGLLSSHVPS